MRQQVETIIIGGGQAGLATSYYLKQHGHEHIILEKATQAGNAWRNGRWDSFTLVTPNWSFLMPGATYAGPEPDGFMPRDEIVATFEQYIARFDLPVQYSAEVTSVEPDASGKGYRVRAAETEFEARNVVIATGLFQQPRIPSFHSDLPAEILQLHSGQYRNPRMLPPGAVLVVGSAQSGCQIAEELYQSGRKVYLCVGSAGRAPRRYRGKDVYEWLHLNGFLNRTKDQLPSPQARFAGNPQLSGRDGGHTLNLHQFVRDGVTLLGRLRGASDGKVLLAPDRKQSLAKIDQFEVNITKLIDGFIEKNGSDVPLESLPQLQDGYAAEELTELDLKSAGITSIIWAMGYTFDFSMVRLPLFEGNGFPLQKHGITDYPGLYFVGLPWLPGQKTGLLLGVGENAEIVSSAILDRKA
jgi:putative flavoprotein involved in K+ transport